MINHQASSFSFDKHFNGASFNGNFNSQKDHEDEDVY